jgi:hypothetical protein
VIAVDHENIIAVAAIDLVKRIEVGAELAMMRLPLLFQECPEK